MSNAIRPAGGVRGMLRYPARHIRWKIIAPYIVLSALIAAAGTFLVTRLVVGSLEERFNNQLAEAARVTSDAFVRRERQHLETVRAIAFTRGVAQATQEGNQWVLADLANPIAANKGQERVEIIGASGDRVFGVDLGTGENATYRALTDEDSRASWPIVQEVLKGTEDGQGDKFAQIIQTRDGYFLYTAGPIRLDGTTVGAVLAASSLDSFLPVAKGEALADITVYTFDGARVASTFTGADEGADADLTPSSDALELGPGAGALREHKELYGRGFDLLYGELVIRGDAVALYSVALPTSFILDASAATRWQMGGLFAIGMVAALVLGWVVSRSLTNPLLRLVAVARAVSAGDLNARARIHTLDEVGALAESFDEMTARLQRQHLSTIKALTGAIDARDPYTLGHSVRVGQLSMMIGQGLGLPEDQLQHLEIGGYLHDIGKIGVRDSILLKPGALTPEERAMIEQHPRIGLDILSPVELPPEVIAFVGGHHEKLDGTGYPQGLKADELTIISRIGSVADIYDALVTDRPYRAGLDPKECMDILKREVWDGKLDQDIVMAMERLVPRWEARRRDDPTLKGYAIPGWQQKAA